MFFFRRCFKDDLKISFIISEEMSVSVLLMDAANAIKEKCIDYKERNVKYLLK